MEVTIIIIVLLILLAWKAYKRYSSFAHRLHRDLKKAGIESEIHTLPDGKTIADVIAEMLGEKDNE